MFIFFSCGLRSINSTQGFHVPAPLIMGDLKSISDEMVDMLMDTHYPIFSFMLWC